MRLPHFRPRHYAPPGYQHHRHPHFRQQHRDLQNRATPHCRRRPEFTTRTHYHILHSPSDAADATLLGTVYSTYTAPLTYDSQTGRVVSALITVSMKVSLTDKHGKVLYHNPAYVFREQYEVSDELNSFFEEDSPAFDRLSQDFARTLVSNILEGF